MNQFLQNLFSGVTIFVIIYFVFATFLSNINGRTWFIPWLTGKYNPRKKYLTILEYTLNWLDRVIGKPGSISSLDWSFVLSFMYPIAFMLIAWLISNSPYVLATFSFNSYNSVKKHPKRGAKISFLNLGHTSK